jgi:hypothetical protein
VINIFSRTSIGPDENPLPVSLLFSLLPHPVKNNINTMDANTAFFITFPLHILLRVNALIAQKSKNAKILIITTLAPAGVAYKYEITIPMKKQMTATTPEQMVTVLNVLKILMDVRAGKMMRLEISKAPIMRIPNTIVSAVRMAISIL